MTKEKVTSTYVAEMINQHKVITSALTSAFCFATYIIIESIKDGTPPTLIHIITGIGLVSISSIPILIGVVIVKKLFKQEIDSVILNMNFKGSKKSIANELKAQYTHKLDSLKKRNSVKLEFSDEWWDILFSTTYGTLKRRTHRDYTLSKNSLTRILKYDFGSYPHYIKEKKSKHSGMSKIKFLITVSNNIAHIDYKTSIEANTHSTAEIFFLEIVKWKYNIDAPGSSPEILKVLFDKIKNDDGLDKGNITIRLTNEKIIDTYLDQQSPDPTIEWKRNISHNAFNIYDTNAISRTLINPESTEAEVTHAPELEILYTAKKIEDAISFFEGVWDKSSVIDKYILENPEGFYKIGDGSFFNSIYNFCQPKSIE